MEHSELQKIAGNPELIETDDELKTFISHLDSCPSCCSIANRWLEIEVTLAPVNQALRQHPNIFLLLYKKWKGLHKPIQVAHDFEQWHADACPICRTRLAKFDSWASPGYALVYAISLIVLIAIFFLYHLNSHDETIRTKSEPATQQTTALAYLSSKPRISAPSHPVERTGSATLSFIPIQQVKQIFVDVQADAFAKQMGISLKQRLKERGYRSVNGMNAEARIKITSMGSKEYLVQYVSGDQTWSIQIHIAQATPEAASIAADLLVTEMFQDMQKQGSSSSGSKQ